MRLLLLGAPGSGKGTQGARIARRYGLPHVSTGELLRDNVAKDTELGRIAKPYMQRGDLVPDDLIIAMVREHRSTLDPDVGYVMDGYPRTLQQAEDAYEVAQRSGTTLHAVVALDIGHDELLARLASRARAEGRTDDTDDTVRHRIEVYEAVTLPLLDYYASRGILHRIDATGTIDEVSERIFASLDGAA
jgi:adenylate kinase